MKQVTSHSHERGTETRPRVPVWRWPVFLVGAACMVILLLSPGLLKAGSNVELLLIALAAVVSVVGCIAYWVGRNSFWSQYAGSELAFVFAPMVLSVVIAVGLLLAFGVFFLVAWNLFVGQAS